MDVRMVNVIKPLFISFLSAIVTSETLIAPKRTSMIVYTEDICNVCDTRGKIV